MTLSVVYFVLMFILVVIFLINSIRYRKEIKDYVKYGVVLGLILISFDIVVVALIPNYFVGRTFYQLLIIDVIAFVKILIFTCMGIYYCSTLGIVDIPLIKRLSGKVDALGNKHGVELHYLHSRSGPWGCRVFCY